MIRKFKRKEILGVVILMILGGVLMYANYADKLPSNFNLFKQGENTAPEVKEYKFSKTTIKSDLSYAAVQKTFSFLTDVYKESSMPEELSLLLQKKGTSKDGDEYAGGWTKDNIFLNVLYVTGPDSNTPNYFRAWYLSTAVRKLDKGRAEDLLGNVFTEKVLALAKDNLICKEAKAENDIPVTVCELMKNVTSGDKEGVLVRTPLIINAVPSTVVSVCRYPSNSRLYKNAVYCL